MYIGDYLRELLVQNNEVSVPGLGVFYLVRKNAYYNEQEGKFYPPYHELQFIAKPKDDNLFINYLADKKNLVKATAIFITEKQVNELLEKAKHTPTELPGIGWFSFENEQIVFKPNNDSVIDSSLFGFAPISLTPPIKEQEVFIEESDLNLPVEPAIEHHLLDSHLREEPSQAIDHGSEFDLENIIEPTHHSAIEHIIEEPSNTVVEDNSIQERINEPDQIIASAQNTGPENNIEAYGHIHLNQPIEDERVTSFHQHADTEHIIGEELAKEPSYSSTLTPPTEDERATLPYIHEESEHIAGAEYAKLPENQEIQDAPIEDERVTEHHIHDESEHFGDEELANKTAKEEHIPIKIEEPRYFEPDISIDPGKAEIVWSFNDAKDEVNAHIDYEQNTKEVVEEQTEQNKIIAKPIERSPIDEAYIEEEEYDYEEEPKRRLSGWAIFFIIFGIIASGFAGLYYYVPAFASSATSIYRNILGISTIDSTKIKNKHNLIKRDTVIDTANKKTVFVEGSKVKVIYFKIIDGKYLKLTQARAEVRRLEDQGVDAEILSNIPGIYLNVSVGSYPTYEKAYKAMKALIETGKINKNSKIIETFQK